MAYFSMGETTTGLDAYDGLVGRVSSRVVGVFLIVVIVLYRDTLWSMVSIWQRSETYAHGYLIAPIALWLVWRKRDALALHKLKPVLWVQLLLIPGGAVWLLANLVDVLVLQQLALVGILIVGIWSIVGHDIARIIAFPLGFLILAVPMGEDLVPPMMEMTATSTVWLIKLTGIPVYREGLYFTLPTGNWSVVEACSGVRYLIASFTLGLLYAHLTYRSLGRKLLFIFASIVVPVAANTGRAYMIVMLGHLSDMSIATGVDHLIYGWVFFGLIMVLLFWVGSFWREDEPTSVMPHSRLATASSNGLAVNPILALCTGVILAGFWPLFSLAIERTSGDHINTNLQAPTAVDGWRLTKQPSWKWQPKEAGADAQQIAFYQRGDQFVALYMQLYIQQDKDVELVSGKPGQFVDEDLAWHISARGSHQVHLGAAQASVYELNLSDGQRQLLLWNWYRIGRHYTANPYMAKWHEAVAAISFGRQDSARIILATKMNPAGDERGILQSFINAHLQGMEAALDTAVQESR